MAKALKIFALHVVGLMFLAFGALPHITHAADLYFSPATGSATVGSGFNVTVKLDTKGAIANAVDVTLNFPADKLRVSSISTTGSALTLWVMSPQWDNAAGTVSFTGGQPRPGFNSSSVTLATITFVPKVTGTANLAFTGLSVLSGDGLASELLVGLGTANYTLNPAPPPPPPPPPTPPPEPVIIYVPVPAPPAPTPEPLVCPPIPVCTEPTTPTTPTETPTEPPTTETPITTPSETPAETPVTPTETPTSPAVTPTPSTGGRAEPVTVANVAGSIQTVTRTVYVNAAQTYTDVTESPLTQTTTSVATPVAIAATAVSAVSLAAAVDIIPLLQYLGALPLLLFRRKTRKNYGVVYDAFTKVPISLATVRLYSLTGHRLVASTVTDLLGRYNLLADPGSYFVEVAKGGFAFPSLSLATAKDDGQYLDVYHGEILRVTETNASVTANIPLDRTASEEHLSPAKIRVQNLWKKFRESSGAIGLGLSFGVFLVRPGILTGALLLLQLLVFTVVKKLGTPNKPTGWGIVYDSATGAPVSNAAVRVFDYQNNKLLQTGITDGRGRYSFMLGPNQYIATIEKPGYEPASIRPIDLRQVKDVVPLTNHIALHQIHSVAA